MAKLEGFGERKRPRVQVTLSQEGLRFIDWLAEDMKMDRSALFEIAIRQQFHNELQRFRENNELSKGE